MFITLYGVNKEEKRSVNIFILLDNSSPTTENVKDGLPFIFYIRGIRDKPKLTYQLIIFKIKDATGNLFRRYICQYTRG